MTRPTDLERAPQPAQPETTPAKPSEPIAPEAPSATEGPAETGAPKTSSKGKKYRRSSSLIVAGIVCVLVCLAGLICIWPVIDAHFVEEQLSSEEYIAADKAVEKQSKKLYGYSLLNKEEKQHYRDFVLACEGNEAAVAPDRLVRNNDDRARIFKSVYADYPWLEHNSVDYHSAEELAQINKDVDAAAEKCLKGISKKASDYEKSKYVYEWLAENTTYNHETFGKNEEDRALYDWIQKDPMLKNPPKSLPEWLTSELGEDNVQLLYNTSRTTQESSLLYNKITRIADSHSYAETKDASAGQTLQETLIDHSAVCGGYANSYCYLMRKLGVPCSYVSGKTHAWCLVELDGDYYYVDPTWGDNDLTSESSEWAAQLGEVSYQFLNTTTDDLPKEGHELDSQWTIELPKCTATADSYYAKEGHYYETADIDRLVSEFGAMEFGKVYRFKCADKKAYETLMSFVDNNELQYHVSYDYSYRSSHDADSRTITIVREQ